MSNQRSASDRHMEAGEAARLADPNLDRVCRMAEEASGVNGNREHLEGLCAHVVARLHGLPTIQQVGIMMLLLKKNPAAVTTTSIQRFVAGLSGYIAVEFARGRS